MPPKMTAKPQRGRMVNPKPPMSFPTGPMPSGRMTPSKGKSATAKSPINPAGKMRGWAKQGRSAPGAPKPAVTQPGAGKPMVPMVTPGLKPPTGDTAQRMTLPGLKAPTGSTTSLPKLASGTKPAAKAKAKARGKSATAHSPINPAGKTRGWAKNRPARRPMPAKAKARRKARGY